MRQRSTDSGRGAQAALAASGEGGDQRWTTLADLLEDAVRRHGDRQAIVDPDRTLTYRELGAEVGRMAAAMLTRGVRVGDRVAIWAPNGWRWPVAALGAQVLGAAIVPLNTRHRGPEAAYVLGRARPRIVVVSDVFLGNDYLAMRPS